MEKQGWQIVPKVKLPKNYSLHEDTTGVYLYTQDELVATFGHFANPHTIKAEAMNHLKKRGAVGEEVGQERSLGVG